VVQAERSERSAAAPQSPSSRPAGLPASRRCAAPGRAGPWPQPRLQRGCGTALPPTSDQSILGECTGRAPSAWFAAAVAAPAPLPLPVEANGRHGCRWGLRRSRGAPVSCLARGGEVGLGCGRARSNARGAGRWHRIQRRLGIVSGSLGTRDEAVPATPHAGIQSAPSPCVCGVPHLDPARQQPRSWHRRLAAVGSMVDDAGADSGRAPGFIFEKNRSRARHHSRIDQGIAPPGQIQRRDAACERGQERQDSS
jgi:hypothetical protein